MTTRKKMKGWMCHSEASAAVCMSHDYRSVIVPPRRLKRTPVRPANRTMYIRLGEQRAVPSSSLENHQEKLRQEVVVSTSPARSDHLYQVVVMRVSIHCQGCVCKVKKHLSKMEGVTSFSIDLESKIVTVTGHVSPSGVLESISKVKKAEFWPS